MPAFPLTAGPVDTVQFESFSSIPATAVFDGVVATNTSIPPTVSASAEAGAAVVINRPADWMQTTFDSFPPAATKQAVVHAKGPVTIVYFGVKARAFLPMLVAEVGGVPYVWKKVAMEDWAPLKGNTPFGQLPIMEHGDIVIAQSTAIAAYIGRLAGMLGTEDADFAMSQMLVAQYEDMLNAMAKSYYSSNKAADMEEYLSVKLPADLGKIEKLVSGGFTNERTIGELAIFAFLNIIMDLKADVLEAFPAINAFYKHLAAQPKVAAFLNNAGEVWYKKDW